jgi:hypothetical protein
MEPFYLNIDYFFQVVKKKVKKVKKSKKYQKNLISPPIFYKKALF